MYDPKQVEDSLEFCKNIRIYYEADKKSPFYDYTKVSKTRKLDMFRNEHMYTYASVESIAVDQISETDTEAKITVFKDLLNIAVCIALAFGIAYLLTTFVAHHTRVEGASMEPTLVEDDILIIEKMSYRFREPERYDIVVFPVADGTEGSGNYYIKRVIGLPGETVQIVNGEVYIDGDLLGEDYGMAEILDPGIAVEPVALAASEYFVLGDNRNFSTDSRSESIGVVTEENIIGRASMRLYPFSEFGSIDKK